MAGNGKQSDSAGVRISHPERVLFPAQGLTKADLAEHYERVAARMLPHVVKRLLSLVRCPEGLSGECFYQRHAGRGFPEALKRWEIEEASGETDVYLYADDLSGLIAGVQMGTLEYHIWGARIDRLERPDRMIFDLDPDEGLDFRAVREAAFEVRERLAEIGLKSLALVTGGKGVHVVVPLTRRAEWPWVKQFARGFAQHLAEANPERYVAQAAKAKRKEHIFIDYLRNDRAQSAIAPYSTRARKGAPVATPVSWDELSSLEAANGFHVGDMADRMKQADPWAESALWRQSVTKRMLEKVKG